MIDLWKKNIILSLLTYGHFFPWKEKIRFQAFVQFILGIKDWIPQWRCVLPESVGAEQAV